MLIKVTEGRYSYDKDPDDCYSEITDLEVMGIYFFDNIDAAKKYAESVLSGTDWTANRPGMVLDTYVYHKQYRPGTTHMLRAFKFIKLEMM